MDESNGLLPDDRLTIFCEVLGVVVISSSIVVVVVVELINV